jgi:hypothetical protein
MPEATSDPLSRALTLAERLHAGEDWKGTGRPYLFHPLAVASLVQRYGGDVEQAAAALVHDAIERPEAAPAALATALGAEVSRLAHAFADPPEAAGVADWGERKKLYLAKVRGLDRRARLIIAAEELHELDVLLDDLRERPPIEVWPRYGATRHNVGWYFREMLLSLQQAAARDPSPTAGERAILATFAGRVRALLPQTFEGTSGSV